MHCDCYSLAAEMAEIMHDLLWCMERQRFVCTGHKGGRQRESSKCDSKGPFRDRQTKKENPHGCTCKSVNKERLNKKRIHKNLQRGTFFSSSYTCTRILYKHTVWHAICLQVIHIGIIKMSGDMAPQNNESLCVSQSALDLAVLCAHFSH